MRVRPHERTAVPKPCVGPRHHARQIHQRAADGRVLLQQAGEHVSLTAADVGDLGHLGEVEEFGDFQRGLHAGGGHGPVEDLGRLVRVLVQVVEEPLSEHLGEDARAGAHRVVQAGPDVPGPGLGAPQGDVPQAVRVVLAQQPGHVGVDEFAVLGLGEDPVAGQGAQQTLQRHRLDAQLRRELLRAAWESLRARRRRPAGPPHARRRRRPRRRRSRAAASRDAG